MRQSIGVHGVRTPQFLACGVHLHVYTPELPLVFKLHEIWSVDFRKKY